MKLAAIYNVWDGVELLEGSIKNINESVDHIIVVYQNTSNYGEFGSPLRDIMAVDIDSTTGRYHLVIYQPDLTISGMQNETNKRNIGIQQARILGCTHFFHIDVDEYYYDFEGQKEEYIDRGHTGSVCPIYTYFKKPIWRLENLDGYYVPFIHELHADTKAGRSSYPFHCDPTRVINQSDVALLSQPMHHFSWVRNDIERKARNSSAGQHGNKLKGLLADYHSPELEAHPEGYIIKDMGNQKIKVVPNIFAI